MVSYSDFTISTLTSSVIYSWYVSSVLATETSETKDFVVHIILVKRIVKFRNMDTLSVNIGVFFWLWCLEWIGVFHKLFVIFHK